MFSEMFSSDLFAAFVWFALGVFSCSAFNTILSYVHGLSFVKEVNEHVIRLLSSIEGDLFFIEAIKYKQMIDAGMSEEDILHIRQLDEHFIKNWQAICINKFFSIYPRSMHQLIPFKDWDGALNLLNDNYYSKVVAQHKEQSKNVDSKENNKNLN